VLEHLVVLALVVLTATVQRQEPLAVQELLVRVTLVEHHGAVQLLTIITTLLVAVAVLELLVAQEHLLKVVQVV
jgi:hypothetical protein